MLFCSPHLTTLCFTSVGWSLYLSWTNGSPKESYMGQLELLAAPAALSTWAAELTAKQVIHFVDNDSAAANLVRGYSPDGPSRLHETHESN